VLVAFRLSGYDSVRLANSASFVADVFQAFIRDFRPKLF
jgi:hypothetical protein